MAGNLLLQAPGLPWQHSWGSFPAPRSSSPRAPLASRAELPPQLLCTEGPSITWDAPALPPRRSPLPKGCSIRPLAPTHQASHHPHFLGSVYYVTAMKKSVCVCLSTEHPPAPRRPQEGRGCAGLIHRHSPQCREGRPQTSVEEINR